MRPPRFILQRRRMTNESHLGHLRRKLRAEGGGAFKPHISGQTIPASLLEPRWMCTAAAMQVPLRQKALSDRRTCRNFHSIPCGITDSFLSVFAAHERVEGRERGHHTKSSFLAGWTEEAVATNKALRHLPSIQPSEAFVLTANKPREGRGDGRE